MNEMTMLLQIDEIRKAAAAECMAAKRTWDNAQAIDAANKPRRPPKSRVKRGFVRDSDITALLANGQSYAQIAEALGMTPSGIAKRVQGNGLREKADKIDRTRAFDNMIVSMLANGLSEYQIAAKTGLSRSGVAGRIQRNRLRERAKGG